MQRNIPTRVGKTACISRTARSTSEHPHACGENPGHDHAGVRIAGTSPRVWGKLQSRGGSAGRDRNIPTRVGKTRALRDSRTAGSEHPHACGENLRMACRERSVSGTSPRVWGKHRGRVQARPQRRNIPTRVGKTPWTSSTRRSTPEHPHACGENKVDGEIVDDQVGTSPRVWGKPVSLRPSADSIRNIPTRVGKT